jgi:gluconolactonase
MDADMLLPLESFIPFADGLDHPEGVAWGLDGFVYAGGEAGQIYHVHPDTGAYTEFANTGGFNLGLAFDGRDNLYVCDNGNSCVQKITPDGTVSVYADGNAERQINVPNYPSFDANGNLWVSDSGGHHEYNGCLWRIDRTGVAHVASTDLNAFPNGTAVHPSGEWLYVVLSNLSGVARVRIHDDGSVGTPETVVELPRTIPDGLAFDVEGNLYVSCYTPDVIFRVTPNGKAETLVDDWESTRIATPTNIAFGGSDMKTLFIASLGRWHLTKGPMPVAGSPLFYPVLD